MIFVKKHLTELKTYKDIHKNIKPYKCDICDKDSNQKINLEIHLKSVHQELKSYKCKVCEKIFGSQNVQPEC